MDYDMDQSAQIRERQETMHTQPTSFGHSLMDYDSQSIERWPTSYIGYALPYQQHWSISSHSTTSSYARSSNNSFVTGFQNRASTISTDSSFSTISNQSRRHHLAQAERSLNGFSSPLSPYTPSPVDAPAPQVTRKRHTPRLPAPEKDYYKTCVSRKQRARRANTVQKYFCTICQEPFVEKADWKRHEETFQERTEEFQCDICYAKYFLDKDFVTHHVQAHGCVHCNSSTRCSLKKHVQESRRGRKSRTGWGCGFCYHFSTNWTERCNHVADHFDCEGKTMSEWRHSCVIYSLLHRPAVLTEWNAILEKRMRPVKSLAWNSHSTGREEGYPDSGRCPRLQDWLEFFTPDQNAAALAQKAFDLAIDCEPLDIAPPVPPKDYHLNHTTSLRDLTNDTESWTQFVKSIVNDDHFPTAVTEPEEGAWSSHDCSWFDPS
ncbi:hypothetical protein ACEQ8H_001982 [Pleosporales sp. CAS-2024a]